MAAAPDNGQAPTMSDAALSELNAVKFRQERIRDSIEDIESQLKEKKKPWYKNAATLMSVAGTLFAVLSGLYSIHSAHTQNVKNSEADLQTIIGQLIQLRTDEIQDLPSAKSDFVGYSERSSLRNTKRLSLLEDAATTIREAPKEVPPSILIVLATETASNGDYATSYKYLTQANQKALPGAPEKVAALYSLAQLCLTNGKGVCTSDQGKADYHEALNQQPGNSDDTLYQRGQLLVNIGLLVLSKGSDADRPEDYFKQADAEDVLISPANGLKQRLAQYIALGRSYEVSARLPHAQSFSTPETFLGTWSLTYVEDHSRTGSVTFVQLPVFPFYVAYIEKFQNGALSEKQQGQVQILDPQTLRIDWTSMTSLGQTAGYSQFSLDSSGTKMNAAEYRLGESVSRFRLLKINRQVRIGTELQH